MSEDRITSTNSYIGEARQEAGLRPQTLDDYIGQQGVKDNLKIFIEAADFVEFFSGNHKACACYCEPVIFDGISVEVVEAVIRHAYKGMNR